MGRRFERTELVLGPNNLKCLAQTTAAVVGLGGVGGAAAEALARSGIGRLILIDHDTVCVTNINRQIIALDSTVGRPKAEVMAERIAQINPACEVRALQVFYTGEEHEKLLGDADYIADAIDSVGPKVELIARSHGLKKPIISSLGMGNKLDPTRIEITDIAKTHTCPLARAVRVSLRKKGIRSGIPVVFSPEPVTSSGGRVPGSTAFVPPAAGLVMASWIVGQVCREV